MVDHHNAVVPFNCYLTIANVPGFRSYVDNGTKFSIAIADAVTRLGRFSREVSRNRIRTHNFSPGLRRIRQLRRWTSRFLQALQFRQYTARHQTCCCAHTIEIGAALEEKLLGFVLPTRVAKLPVFESLQQNRSPHPLARKLTTVYFLRLICSILVNVHVTSPSSIRSTYAASKLAVAADENAGFIESVTGKSAGNCSTLKHVRECAQAFGYGTRPFGDAKKLW